MKFAYYLSAMAIAVLSGCGGGSSEASQDVQKTLCFDNSIYAAGAELHIEYAESSFAVGSLTETSIVLSNAATYNGNNDLVHRVVYYSRASVREELRYRYEGSYSKYEKPLTPGITQLYLTDSRGRLGRFRSVAYNPPYVDRRAELKLGQMGVFTATGAETSSENGPTPFTRQTRITFVGVESISLPAGEYQACRYDIRDYEGTTSSEWIYRGAVIRSERQTGTTAPEILEMKVGTLNGAPL